MIIVAILEQIRHFIPQDICSLEILRAYSALAALKSLQTRALRFLSHIDPLNSMFNYYFKQQCKGDSKKKQHKFIHYVIGIKQIHFWYMHIKMLAKKGSSY